MKIIYRIFVVAVFSLISHVAISQQNNSLYFLDRVPQNIQLNPAHQPSSTFYIGFPALSSFEINAGNNALGLNDIIIKNSETGSSVNPFFSKEISTQTLNKLQKNNIFSTDAQFDLISFGFKIKDSYVSFLISEKFSMKANIPKEMALFAYEGIDVGQSYSFDINANASYFREYSIGYSQKISEKMYFGVRGKMLFGKANISSTQTNISLNEPDWRTIEMSSSVRVNTSVPLLDVFTSASGRVDSIALKDLKQSDIKDVLLLNKNRGFGFDLGFQFNINEKMSLSASVLDLGYINWKANINTLSGGGDYKFQGIDLNNDSIELEEALLDSLQESFDLTSSFDPYNTLLTPKLYVGFSYAPYKFVKFGLLSRSEYAMKTFRQQVTGSMTLYPLQFFGATFSYTVANRLYDNLGIGLIFRSGPLQMYFMSERIPIVWNRVKDDVIPFLPAYAKDVNFRMGLNFVLGTNIHRKLIKDQPFLD